MTSRCWAAPAPPPAVDRSAVEADQTDLRPPLQPVSSVRDPALPIPATFGAGRAATPPPAGWPPAPSRPASRLPPANQLPDGPFARWRRRRPLPPHTLAAPLLAPAAPRSPHAAS